MLYFWQPSRSPKSQSPNSQSSKIWHISSQSPKVTITEPHTHRNLWHRFSPSSKIQHISSQSPKDFAQNLIFVENSAQILTITESFFTESHHRRKFGTNPHHRRKFFHRFSQYSKKVTRFKINSDTFCFPANCSS